MCASPFVVRGRKVLWSDVVLTLKAPRWEGCELFIETNQSRIHGVEVAKRLDRRERAATEERAPDLTIVFSFCNPPGQSRSQFIIGRDPTTCDIVCTSLEISNQHVKFGVEGEHVVMYDVSSRGSQLALGGREPQWTWPKPGIPYRCILPPNTNITLRISDGLVFQIDVPALKGTALQEFTEKRDAFHANCSDFGALNVHSQIPTKSATPSQSATRKRREHMYWFESKLGEGGFGSVHRVRRLQDWAVFAAKQVIEHGRASKSLADRPSVIAAKRANLEEEMKTLQRLQHERIVKYVDWYEDQNDRWVLVMEHCPQGSLQDKIRKEKVPFAPSMTAEILKQVAEGLLYLHGKGITHRDLKPGNILVRSWSPLSLALCDFGLAKQRRAFSGSVMYTTCGTPSHMAPEMWTHGAGYTKAIDIWALGVVGAELLGTKIPGLKTTEEDRYPDVMFQIAETMSDNNPGNRLVALVERMLAWNPADRPTTAECIRDASDLLKPIAASQLTLPKPATTPASSPRQNKEGDPGVQSSRGATTLRLRSSEMRSLERQFQTSGWRAAQAGPPANPALSQQHTPKRGTDALPRSNSLEASAPKLPRINEQTSQQARSTSILSRPDDPVRAAGQSLGSKKDVRTSTALPQPKCTPSHQTPQSTGKDPSHAAPLPPNLPRTATRKTSTSEKTARKMPPIAEEKEPHPQRHGDTASLPRPIDTSSSPSILRGQSPLEKTDMRSKTPSHAHPPAVSSQGPRRKSGTNAPPPSRSARHDSTADTPCR